MRPPWVARRRLGEPPALLRVLDGHSALAPHTGYCQPVHRRSPMPSLAVNGSWTHGLALGRRGVMFTLPPATLRVTARFAHPVAGAPGACDAFRSAAQV